MIALPKGPAAQPARYDSIGDTYTQTRRTEPRFEHAIHAALGGASTVLNVGAGTGSYEPQDRHVIAVDPSIVMLGQRPSGAGQAVLATAEALPFDDQTFDSAMATTTVHHWSDLGQGLREMRRVSRRQVILLCELSHKNWMWLTDDYFPEAVRIDTEIDAIDAEELMAPHLDLREIRALPVPADCADGFGGAYWCRPEQYLLPGVRAGISLFRLLASEHLARGVDRLTAELADGTWDRKYGYLRALPELDLGYRLVIAGDAP